MTDVLVQEVTKTKDYEGYTNINKDKSKTCMLIRKKKNNL